MQTDEEEHKWYIINNTSAMRAIVLWEGLQFTQKPVGEMVKERLPRSREREAGQRELRKYGKAVIQQKWRGSQCGSLMHSEMFSLMYE